MLCNFSFFVLGEFFMRKILSLAFILLSFPTLASIDLRFPETPTYMSKANMIRFQYLSQEGAECTAGVSSKLISRVPYYVYAPATSATQLKTGKYAAVIFLHGKGEQGASVLNMCYTRDDAYYTTIATNLVKVENPAGGPGAAILNGQFNPQEKMVVIIPQSMQKGGFSSDIIRRVIADTAVQLASKGIELDADRIYLTGLSMGGGSVHKYITDYPEHFSASVPIEAAGGIDACLLRAKNVSYWGFAGGATGNMGSANLKSVINGAAGCLESTIEYKNPAYTCLYNGKSCTLLSAAHPTNLRATFMPNDGHSGWRNVYNGTHSALPTTENNIYNWMLTQKNSDQGKPLFPIEYNTVSSTSSSLQKSSSSSSLSSTQKSSSSSSIASNSKSSTANSSSIQSNTIILSPRMILAGAPANASALVDEQNSSAPTSYWFAGWSASTYPIEAIINLGKVYTVTEISLYDANGVGLVEVSDGDLSHSQDAVVSESLIRYLKFNTYSVNLKTQYIRVKKFDAALMNEIKIKGY